MCWSKCIKYSLIILSKDFLTGFIGFLKITSVFHFSSFSSVQSSHSVMSDSLQPPWTAAHQASLSVTNSRSLLKLTSIELVMPFKHLILCCTFLLLPSSFPSITVFSRLFTSGRQSIGCSASASEK